MNVSEMTREIRREISAKEEQMSDEEVLSFIEHYVLERDSLSICDLGESHKMIMRIFYSIRKDLDILQPYADDETVSEIMVNGKDDIFIERNGIIEKTGESFEKTEDLEEVIRRAAAGIHREINELSPIVDARLHDGSRINAVYKNIALNGPILTIRKFPKKAFNMKDLISFGTLTEECADYLKTLVETGYNCFISGGTSSGKTTFLNVLTDYIPKEERIIVIEDSAELQIKGIKNMVRMECKNANVQGKGQITMQQLIKTSLRMRPDRIIVGEVRGKEVMDMIQAMNTGHDGSLSTGHGNSIEGMLRRLESMFLQAADFPIDAIRSQIAEGIDIIIHLSRLTDKERKVLEISEIKGVEKDRIVMNSLYKYIPGKGLEKTGNRLMNREKLKLKGYKMQ
ncbi:MAG TPA: ATPase, T2SS/T4P/T4SS family [Bacillota bacterium]|nr:ATPase, T2SS/T4P/T4SS family [Bacillota bacterium]